MYEEIVFGKVHRDISSTVHVSCICIMLKQPLHHSALCIGIRFYGISYRKSTGARCIEDELIMVLNNPVLNFLTVVLEIMLG